MDKSTFTLSYFNVEDKKLRYINYIPTRSGFTTSCHADSKSVLLILGSDILAFSKHPSNHHGRIHIRFAKLGMATKVHFKDCYFDSITSSSGLWFYDIHGLFRVAFEYLNVDMQRFCLQNFTDVWLSSVAHFLPENLNLALLPLSDGIQLKTVPAIVQQTEMSPPCINLPQVTVQFYPTTLAEQESLPCSIETCCVLRDTNSPLEESSRLFEEVKERLRSVEMDSDTIEKYTGRLHCLLTFFHCELDADQQCDENSDFPYDVFEEFTNLVNSDGDISIGAEFESADGYDVTGRHGLMLRLVSRWIANKFASQHEIISRHANDFKTQNIGQIDHLPSPRDTVNFIFPQSMVQLLLGWIGPAFENRTNSMHRNYDSVGCSNTDHCYVSNLSCEHLYTFVQLILEFANNCLVSGVAHVLYPRLLASQL